MALTWKEHFYSLWGFVFLMDVTWCCSPCFQTTRGKEVYWYLVQTFGGDTLYYYFICILDSFQTHCSKTRNSFSSPVIRMVSVESEKETLTCILNNCKALGLSQGVSRKCRIHQGHLVPLRGYYTQFKVCIVRNRVTWGHLKSGEKKWWYDGWFVLHIFNRKASVSANMWFHKALSHCSLNSLRQCMVIHPHTSTGHTGDDFFGRKKREKKKVVLTRQTRLLNEQAWQRANACQVRQQLLDVTIKQSAPANS